MSADVTRSRESGDHVNTGVIALRVPDRDRGIHHRPMTVIVSGVGRSGTSMIAKVVDAIGIPMGRTDGLAVCEDREFNTALCLSDYHRLRQIIRDRDATHERWGVKLASLQNQIFPPQLNYFRSPRLIIVMRDVAATAARSHKSGSEKTSLQETLRNVAKQTLDMVTFIENATCPTLVISYEKLIAFPDSGIDQIANFCRIDVSEDARRRARTAIEPNNPAYIGLFHPKHRGHFDSVKQGFVIGWCAAIGSTDPIEVELLADGHVLASTMADIYRGDLLAAGIGNGCHGFRFDISGFALNDETTLHVRTVGGAYVVPKSGRRLKDFPAR
jgi:hypothetical protein